MDITWTKITSTFRTPNTNKPPCTWYSDCYLLSLSVSPVELLSFGLALNHWIHCLQVGGVRHERQRDVPVRLTVDPLVVHPKVVFDITRTLQVEKRLWSKASVVSPQCFSLCYFSTASRISSSLTSSAASNLGSN